MGYRIEYECDQTFVDPTTGAIGIRAGERRPEGHEDIGPTWKPVIVEVEDEKKSATVTPQPPPEHHAPAVQQPQHGPQSPKTEQHAPAVQQPQPQHGPQSPKTAK